MGSPAPAAKATFFTAPAANRRPHPRTSGHGAVQGLLIDPSIRCPRTNNPSKEKLMRTKIMVAVISTAAVGLAGGVGIAGAAGGGGGASRLDDGKDLLPQAQVTEQQAIAAAQTAASGALNEVDLEHAGGKLVFNVDVGSHDVKVDATTGQVVAVDTDD
jgi:uncharacterized membrane protein YkoI